MPAPSNPCTQVIYSSSLPTPSPQGYPPGLISPYPNRPASKKWWPQRPFPPLWWHDAGRERLPLSQTPPKMPIDRGDRTQQIKCSCRLPVQLTGSRIACRHYLWASHPQVLRVFLLFAAQAAQGLILLSPLPITLYRLSAGWWFALKRLRFTLSSLDRVSSSFSLLSPGRSLDVISLLFG